jgi:hypothetical protein
VGDQSLKYGAVCDPVHDQERRVCIGGLMLLVHKDADLGRKVSVLGPLPGYALHARYST